MLSPQFCSLSAYSVRSYLKSASSCECQRGFREDPPWRSAGLPGSGEAEAGVEGCSSPWVGASLAEAAFYFWGSGDLTARIGFQREVAMPTESSLSFLGQRQKGICTLRAIFRKPEPWSGQQEGDWSLSGLLWSLSWRCALAVSSFKKLSCFKNSYLFSGGGTQNFLKGSGWPPSLGIMDFLKFQVSRFWYWWNLLDGMGLGFQMASAVEGPSSEALAPVVKFRGLEKATYILHVSEGSPKWQWSQFWKSPIKDQGWFWASFPPFSLSFLRLGWVFSFLLFIFVAAD